ncbi:hypothetical protein AEGHOMDF_3761 [Methylobacterium soli]|nr:hypothetical protein AEGHOMDF_3761 [Methylobacterium soli]
MLIDSEDRMPAVTRPETVCDRRAIVAWASATSRWIGWTSRCSVRPAAVGTIAFGWRSNRRWPSSRSSLAICMLSAGWTTFTRWAARVTLPSSNRATK